MKKLNRIRYWTMNSWNKLSSIAYNLKVYNVIDRDLQNKVYELMDSEDFYNEINDLVYMFDIEHKPYKAGFNGRSGGYLVLYKDGKNHLELDDIPVNVRKAFRQLAIDIVKHVEYMAKHYKVETQEIQVTKQIKVLSEVN